MNKELFTEFDEVSAKQWKQKIQFDLKGADYNQTLVWKSRDGVDVKPFYHPEEFPDPIPVDPPKAWNVCEKIYAANAEKANAMGLKAIEKGAESLWLIIPSEDIDPGVLLSGLDLQNIPVYLEFKFLPAAYFSTLKDLLQGQDHQVRMQLDIIGGFARSGNWVSGRKEDYRILENIFTQAPGFSSVLSIDAGLYQNAGANIPQQLAYALAHANEYLNHFGVNSAKSLQDSELLFKVSTGPDYFFEIAKIRALRLLYATLAREYELPQECHVLTQPSRRNKTLYDYNVNLLRTTTECMSAILGGSNSICNMPYDALYHKNNEFGARIARNQLLILKKESFFDKVANPAEGSYYVETLTRQFAEKALDIFKEIEKGGGFLAQLMEGKVQKKITESAKAEQQQFDSGELVLVGTNKFQNPEDKMKPDIEIFPFLKKIPRKTLIPPVLEKRLSEKLEQERLEQE